nr:retrotransposon Orf1 [Tanacetum cinerariifolium]
FGKQKKHRSEILWKKCSSTVLAGGLAIVAVCHGDLATVTVWPPWRFSMAVCNRCGEDGCSYIKVSESAQDRDVSLGEADSEILPKRILWRKLFKTCCMNWEKLIQPMHTIMVSEQVKTMKIQAGVKVSRPGELRRHLQLWKRFGRHYFIVIVLVRNIVRNFTYVLDFMIVEYISSVINPRVSHVVLGKPFVELSGMTYDSSLGVVRLTNGNKEITYKMPHKIEQYDSLSNDEKENIKLVYLRNDKDKKK